MKNIGTFFAVLLCLMAAGIAQVWAVPAYPGPVVYTQSDGTQIKARIIGDEFLHYILSEEGYTLTGGPGGDLYYATLSPSGELVPTTVRARPLAQLPQAERARVSQLVRGIRPVLPAATKERMRAFRPAPGPVRASGEIAPPGRISSTVTTGRVRSLVVLVQYPDRKFVTPSPQQAFQDLLMQDGYSANGATGSAWNYYYDNSNGQFDPDFVVVGPYTASQNSIYYAGESGTENTPELIVEACRLADNDVNFAEYADNGVIRDVFVFYAGQGRASGGDQTTVWPHRWNVQVDSRFRSVFLDGAHLQGYACACELNYSRKMAGIGTFCHEFGHVLGWPDFYDTDYAESGGTAPGLGTFSLMCSGSYNNDSRTPPAVNILERWMVGWAEPQQIVASGAYTLPPVWENKGYLVPTPVENDYFLLECRAVEGFRWDQHMTNDNGQPVSEKGMLVYHVDYTPSYQDQWIYYNNLNASPLHECMKRVHAYKDGSSVSYFYPGKYDVETLSHTSNKLYNAWTNAAPNVAFSSISMRANSVRLIVDGEFVNLEITSEEGQYDALLSWRGDVAPRWRVEWRTVAGEAIGNATVDRASHLITGLKPATEYEVGITPLGGSVDEVEQLFRLRTRVRNESRKPHISIPADGFKAGEPFVLSVRDCPETVSSVEWYIDGQSSEGYLTLDAGEYAVRALVLSPGGAKFHLIKYITVK